MKQGAQLINRPSLATSNLDSNLLGINSNRSTAFQHDEELLARAVRPHLSRASRLPIGIRRGYRLAQRRFFRPKYGIVCGINVWRMAAPCGFLSCRYNF